MTKVGIMSMQRIANYGSFLQAYALKKIMEELGCEVQFVDYHPGATLIPSDEGRGLKRKVSKTLEALNYSAPIKEKIRFINYKRNFTSHYYPLLGVSNLMNYAPELDLLIIGSDEVFNCVQSNTNVGFSPELFGVGNHAKKLISYAASFGNTTIEKLRQYGVVDQIREWLQEFDRISVRDANSGNVVVSLIGEGGVKSEYHLDPVLIYDFMDKCKPLPQVKPDSKYLILYGYSGRFSSGECEAIKSYAKKRSLEIYCIGGIQAACDRFLDCDPFKVISYFLNAECVITDTFHGTILSVIAHKQFVSYVRSSGYGNSEKLTDLLERLGLRERAISDSAMLQDMLDKIEINYEPVDALLCEERKRSYEYLNSNVT